MGFEEHIRRTSTADFYIKRFMSGQGIKLGDKRTDWLAAASPGDITVGE